LSEEELFNDFIEGHHEELRGMYSLLEFLKEGNKLIATENMTVDFSTTETNIKYYCFLTSAFLDLLTSLKGFLTSKTEWEIIFYSKSGFLAIYETVKTYHKYQKDFRIIVDKHHPHLKEEYTELNLVLKKFKSDFEYDTKISTLRNKAGGHFNEDFLVYYEQIRKIDKQNSVNAIKEFLDFIKSLMKFIFKMATETEKISKESADKAKNEFLRKIEELNVILSAEKN
jgi:hypothetical protein